MQFGDLSIPNYEGRVILPTCNQISEAPLHTFLNVSIKVMLQFQKTPKN
jgi:hypothetical protein